MAAQQGRYILLKIHDGLDPGSYETVAGLQARSISLNARAVEATDSDSDGAWRELIGGAGVKSATVSGAGIFRDEAADETVRGVFFDQVLRDWEVTIPDFGTLTGPFLVSALEYSGRHDGEAQYAITLASGGAINFAAM